MPNKLQQGCFQQTDATTTARRLGINVMNVQVLERYVEKYMLKKKSLDTAAAAEENERCCERESIGADENMETTLTHAMKTLPATTATASTTTTPTFVKATTRTSPAANALSALASVNASSNQLFRQFSLKRPALQSQSKSWST